MEPNSRFVKRESRLRQRAPMSDRPHSRFSNNEFRPFWDDRYFLLTARTLDSARSGL
jgi:hypothetical protein